MQRSVMQHLKQEMEIDPSSCARPLLHMLTNCNSNNINKIQPLIDLLVNRATINDQAVCPLISEATEVASRAKLLPPHSFHLFCC